MHRPSDAAPAARPATRRRDPWWCALATAPCPTCEDAGPHVVAPVRGRAHVTCRGCHTLRTVEEPRDA